MPRSREAASTGPLLGFSIVTWREYIEREPQNVAKVNGKSISHER
jgi:hypothetical protein